MGDCHGNFKRKISEKNKNMLCQTHERIDLFGNLDREEKKKYNIHEVKGRWTTKKE